MITFDANLRHSCAPTCPYPIERWANQPMAAGAVAFVSHETIASIDYSPPELLDPTTRWIVIACLALMAWGVFGAVWHICRALAGTW